MTLKNLGFVLTIGAVLVLLGSMVMGLRGIAGEGAYEVATFGETPEGPPQERIRVEVLNAAGISGLARRVTDRLRDAGFDVVYYGNARGDLDRDSTTILDRIGNEAAVTALADELGVYRIEAAIDTTLYLEATVIVGDDWVEEEGS